MIVRLNTISMPTVVELLDQAKNLYLSETTSVAQKEQQINRLKQEVTQLKAAKQAADKKLQELKAKIDQLFK